MTMFDECTNKEIDDQTFLLIILTIILPCIFNLVTIASTAYIIYMVVSLKKLVEWTTLKAHWLLRTALKAGIGYEFHEKMNKYAITKDDLGKLIQPLPRR